MGNKQTADAGKKKRESLNAATVNAERQAQEKLRHQEKVMLGFFDSINIPLDDQVVTWVKLKDNNIVQLKYLAHQTLEALEQLGIKHENAVKIVNGKPAEYEYMPTKLQASTIKRNSAAVSQPQEQVKRPSSVPPKLSKYIKGDKVEHYREADQLIRKGKVVGVHLDDPESGPYYTMAMDDGNELQCLENKLEYVGGWEAKIEAKRRESMQADEDLL